MVCQIYGKRTIEGWERGGEREVVLLQYMEVRARLHSVKNLGFICLQRYIFKKWTTMILVKLNMVF